MASLSRLYRPKTFADICGQSQLTETLRREVEQKKLGHAYLFSGPRGVGKTTAARIFAKAVNCENPQKGEPCLKCASCLRIAENKAIDIIEIDAASHRGVTEVQESIIDHVKFVPAALKFKVYILDEAHMLTDHAWNALLKTIEEPPEYAIFVFATTERHKVPATIVSRCQRFEFGRIEPEEIKNRLKNLAENEKIKVDEDVLALIASKAEGCLRDAENLLTQLISLGEKKITAEIANIVIPASQKPIAAELLKSVITADSKTILEQIETLEQQGVSFIPLFDDLIESLRDLLIAKNLEKHFVRLQHGTESERALASLVGKTETGILIQASHILMERRREAKNGIDPRFALELGLLAVITLAQPDTQKHSASEIPAATDDRFNEQKQTESSAKNIEISDHTYSTNGDNAESGKSKPRNISNLNISVEDVQRIWRKFLQGFEDQKSLLLILKPCQVVGVKDNCINLKVEYAIHKKSLENAKNKTVIENKLAELLGAERVTISCVMDDVVSEESVDIPLKNTASSIIDAFGGELI